MVLTPWSKTEKGRINKKCNFWCQKYKNGPECKYPGNCFSHFFVWNWILHVWNGFYTLCHSKIGLFNNWLQLDNFGLLPPSDCPPYSLINNHLYCLKTTIVRKPKPSVKHILFLLDCFIGVFRHQESLLMVPFELFQQVFQRAPFDSCSVLPEKF